jgi:hypothetical protein
MDIIQQIFKHHYHLSIHTGPFFFFSWYSTGNKILCTGISVKSHTFAVALAFEVKLSMSTSKHVFKMKMLHIRIGIYKTFANE